MKHLTVKASLARLRICIIATILVITSLFLFSFSSNRMADDFSNSWASPVPMQMKKYPAVYWVDTLINTE
ncbi:MAG: hypothetical protein IPP72_21825 [Chitinophagaceae bacterium]|nr:hypothetical protein [Chitinophagaceae bacterium]